MLRKFTLPCDICGVEEDITLEGDVIAFRCGYRKTLTDKDLDELFRRYGGEL